MCMKDILRRDNIAVTIWELAEQLLYMDFRDGSSLSYDGNFSYNLNSAAVLLTVDPNPFDPEHSVDLIPVSVNAVHLASVIMVCYILTETDAFQ